jgi:prophage regulatory protein
MVGLETSQIYQLIAESKFPAPVPIGARAVAWVEDEILAWIDERIAARIAKPKNNSRSQIAAV